MQKSLSCKLKKQPRVFRSLIGITPEKFDLLYLQLLPLYQKEEQQRFNKKNRKRRVGGGRKKDHDLQDQILLTLMYYRHYVSQSFLGIIFNLHNSNVSRRIRYIEPLLAKIFKIPMRKIDQGLSEDQVIEYIIDATEQQINRPKKDQKRYYSGKKKKHTLKNQIVIDSNSKICSVSKSVEGKKHDKKLYDESRIYTKQASHFKGDLGYLGTERIAVPKKKPKKIEFTTEEKDFNKEFSKERIKVEHVFGKMKVFQILTQRFRNPRAKHALIFKNIAGLYNLNYT
jgi:hypothetical protein